MTYVYEKPDNLVDWFETAVKKYATKPLFGTKDTQGTYQWQTYAEIDTHINNCRAGLAQRGIRPGDTVAFIGNNRWEWAVVAFATYGLGAKFVPMYESEKPHIWHYITEHSEAKILIASTTAIAKTVEQQSIGKSALQQVIALEAEPDTFSFTNLLHLGQQHPCQSYKPAPNDVAVLIYTSGTTGQPKGVLLSHGNLTHDARAGYNFYKTTLTEGSVSLSILPWAHSYGQVAELYNWMLFGGRIGFMERVETLAEDMLKVRPTFLLAVPRVFNKIHEGIHRKVAEDGGIKARIFHWAVAIAQQKSELAQQGKHTLYLTLANKLADKLVFSKIRARFGGRLKGALTASAMMNPDISQFFWNIGLPVADAYGLTETSPALAMNRFEEFRLGSIGKPLNGVTIKIDQSVVEPGSTDGEIIAYGPIIMQGYYKDPAATAAVMTPDGGFRTGDRGRYDADGFLYITGRIKEQYKLENGKYIFPASIEEEMKLLPYIENAMVHGDARPFNVALVVLDMPLLKKWAKAAHLLTNLSEITHNRALQDFLSSEITAHLRLKYGGYEVPKRYLFIDEPFSLDNGLLTQTFKLKRQLVLQRYHELISTVYTKPLNPI